MHNGLSINKVVNKDNSDEKEKNYLKEQEKVLRTIIEDTHNYNSYYTALGRKSLISILIFVLYLIKPTKELIREFKEYVKETYLIIEDKKQNRAYKEELNKQKEDFENLIGYKKENLVNHYNIGLFSQDSGLK